jgi:hypothetical protein
MKTVLSQPLLRLSLFLWLPLFFGCASQQSLGSLSLEPKYSEDQTLERIQRDWEAHYISYIGRFQGSPTAVVFDPKEDDRALRQAGWTQVEDAETLRDVIQWVRSTQFDPRLYQILGPGGEFYGYLYSAWDNHVLVKLADENTLTVYIQEVPIHF